MRRRNPARPASPVAISANVAGSGVRDKITDLGASEFATDLTFIQS